MGSAYAVAPRQHSIQRDRYADHDHTESRNEIPLEESMCQTPSSDKELLFCLMAGSNDDEDGQDSRRDSRRATRHRISSPSLSSEEMRPSYDAEHGSDGRRPVPPRRRPGSSADPQDGDDGPPPELQVNLIVMDDNAKFTFGQFNGIKMIDATEADQGNYYFWAKARRTQVCT